MRFLTSKWLRNSASFSDAGDFPANHEALTTSELQQLILGEESVQFHLPLHKSGASSSSTQPDYMFLFFLQANRGFGISGGRILWRSHS
jgi:hypothetical protein